MTKKILAMLLMCCCVVMTGQASPATLEAEKFLQITRSRAAVQNSFADLRGKVSHLRRNQGGALEYPVRFAVRFGKDKIQGKLSLNNGEIHSFERSNQPGGKLTVRSNAAGESMLSRLGFRVEDLAMDFLNYQFHSEQPTARHKTLACRVLVMLSSDNKPVKVWIASEFFFPLKAEFYESIKDIQGKPVRTLEITGFEKVNNYYVATDIALLSKDFRSRIAFKDCQAFSADDPRALAEFK